MPWAGEVGIWLLIILVTAVSNPRVVEIHNSSVSCMAAVWCFDLRSYA